MSGIVAKQKSPKSREYDSRAKRYVFYPLQRVDFAGSQATSPIWKPKIPKGRLVLFEEFTYMANAEDEMNKDDLFSQGAGLVETQMGTDAQVRFVLSQFGNRGMVEIKSLIDVDVETASEIDELLFGQSYANLPEFKRRLLDFKFEDGNPIHELAKQVRDEAVVSIDKSIAWAHTYCNELERDVQEGRAGRRGRTKIDAYDKHVYQMANRATPRDADLPFQGTQENTANAVLQQLADLLKPQNQPSITEMEEKEAFYMGTIEALRNEIAELKEVKKSAK